MPAGSALVLVGLRPTPNPTRTQPNGSLQVGRKEDDPALRWGASSFFVPLLPLWGAYFRCRERAVREPLENR